MDSAIVDGLNALMNSQPVAYAALSVAAISAFSLAAYGMLSLLSRVLRLRW
ncbi:MAG: hypothetical protein HYX90_06420 [Chloroflexi bacterium]|nr:hypothetical protein [Chloroflexota bacterium]